MSRFKKGEEVVISKTRELTKVKSMPIILGKQYYKLANGQMVREDFLHDVGTEILGGHSTSRGYYTGD